MSSPMTLREAVEIVRWLLPRVEDYADLGAYVKALDEFHRKRVRSRAIVDAAVEAHEADCKDDDYPGDYDTLMKAINARKKLRALERGLESEVQP